MRVGAHVPTRGRPARAVDHARAAGCQAFQIFASNPRGWAPPGLSLPAAEEFAQRRAELRLGPVFVHSSYLVNIASPDEVFRRRSVDLARRELDAARTLGADGLVVHAGAGAPGERAAALHRAAASVLAIAGSDGPDVLLELTAGGAGTVASTIPQAAELLAAVGGHPRVGLCLDTCHLFAGRGPRSTIRTAPGEPWPRCGPTASPDGCGWCTRTTPAIPGAHGATGTNTPDGDASGKRGSGPCWPTRPFAGARSSWRRPGTWRPIAATLPSSAASRASPPEFERDRARVRKSTHG